MKCDKLEELYAGQFSPSARVYGALYVNEAIAELKQTIDELVGVKKSAEQILQNLLDCGLIKEWYFNGKFNVVLKADDTHLQIAKLQAENAQLKKETEFMNFNCRWHAGDACFRLLGEKLEIIHENVKLRQKLESVQASMYCDVVDANMENRRLKRALWLILADLHASKAQEYARASLVAGMWLDENDEKQCYRKEKCAARCRDKAEEYK